MVWRQTAGGPRFTGGGSVRTFIGAGLGARWGGFTARESLRVGVGMVSRGEVGLIVAGVGIGAGLIAQDTFAIVVIVVLITTLVTPLLLRWAYRTPRRR